MIRPTQIHSSASQKGIKIYWPMYASNEQVHRRANTEAVGKANGKTEVDTSRERAAHEQQLLRASCTNLGIRRQTQESKT